MKYIEAIELVLRKLAGGDVTDNYQIKEEEVFMVMKSILPLLIRKDYIESYQLTLNAIDANLITTIICNVYRDDNVKEGYVILPNPPMLLMGASIPKVEYIKDRFVDFIYIDVNKVSSYKSLGILNEIDATIFTYERIQNCGDSNTEDRLIFFNLEDCVERLRVRMIQNTDSSNYNINDVIPIKQELLYQLMQETYNWFVPQDQAQEDKIMDNKNNNIS